MDGQRVKLTGATEAACEFRPMSWDMESFGHLYPLGVPLALPHISAFRSKFQNRLVSLSHCHDGTVHEKYSYSVYWVVSTKLVICSFAGERCVGINALGVGSRSIGLMFGSRVVERASRFHVTRSESDRGFFNSVNCRVDPVPSRMIDVPRVGIVRTQSSALARLGTVSPSVHFTKGAALIIHLFFESFYRR